MHRRRLSNRSRELATPSYASSVPNLTTNNNGDSTMTTSNARRGLAAVLAALVLLSAATESVAQPNGQAKGQAPAPITLEGPLPLPVSGTVSITGAPVPVSGTVSIAGTVQVSENDSANPARNGFTL